MEQKKGAGRIAKWDNARWILITLDNTRAILIALVVLGHILNYANPKYDIVPYVLVQQFLDSFHMPAFFLIAGLFSKKTVEDRRIDKVAPYILIYIFIKID